MEPIISPWVIYWLGVLPVAKGFFIMAPGIVLICSLVPHINEDTPDRWLCWLKKSKTFLSLVIMAVLCIVFVPSRDTALAMIAANHITPNNITKAVQAGSDWKETLKADVIDVIQAVQKPKKEQAK